MKLSIENQYEGYDAPEAVLQAVLDDAFAAYGEGDGSVQLLLVSDACIAEYNQKYKHHEGPTDVLAFEDGEMDPDSGMVHVGDIMVSVDTARRVAVERDLPMDDELVLYALHGLLHLLGMRDHDDASRAQMVCAQQEVFARHGLRFDM